MGACSGGSRRLQAASSSLRTALPQDPGALAGLHAAGSVVTALAGAGQAAGLQGCSGDPLARSGPAGSRISVVSSGRLPAVSESAGRVNSLKPRVRVRLFCCLSSAASCRVCAPAARPHGPLTRALAAQLKCLRRGLLRSSDLGRRLGGGALERVLHVESAAPPRPPAVGAVPAGLPLPQPRALGPCPWGAGCAAGISSSGDGEGKPGRGRVRLGGGGRDRCHGAGERDAVTTGHRRSSRHWSSSGTGSGTAVLRTGPGRRGHGALLGDGAAEARPPVAEPSGARGAECLAT